MQQIKGNICPHIKKAIKECLKVEKNEINSIWEKELVFTENNNKKLMPVSSNIPSYAKIMNKLIQVYKLYEESVDTIVEVWMPMLNKSDSLKETFNLLIMTEFDENIWSDRNIKIVIEELVQNNEALKDYKKQLTEMLQINDKLEKIRKYSIVLKYLKIVCRDSKETKISNFG